MKKGFRYYTVCWAILLAAFNIVAFAARPILMGFVVRYDARFWIAWVFVMAAFIGQLACANLAFKSENKQKLFYNIPIIQISYGALVLMVAVACACMLISDCPAWLPAVLCVIIFALNAVSVVKAKGAAAAVEHIDEKVKVQTYFIRSLTADAKSLMARANGAEQAEALKKVYAAVRCSDPMSAPALDDIEAEIASRFAELKAAVTANNSAAVAVNANEFIMLIKERNNKCKVLK